MLSMLRKTTDVYSSTLIYAVPGRGELGFMRAKGDGICEKQDVLSNLWDHMHLLYGSCVFCGFCTNFAWERLMVSHIMKTLWLVFLEIKEEL